MANMKKILGNIGKLFSVIPDTTQLIGKTIEHTSPIIAKELERRHQTKESLIKLDDVIHLNVDEAKLLLEKKGFKVSLVLVQPDQKFRSFERHQVVKMNPNGGQHQPDTLVKLYYVNDTILSKCQALFEEKQQKKKENYEKLAKLVTVKPIKTPFFNKKSSSEESEK